MSDVRYFKKFDPRQKVMLSDGSWFAFPTEMDGRKWGVLETKNDGLIDELRKAIAKEVGGITEIDEAEYLDLKKKASSLPLRTLSSEAVSLRTLRRGASDGDGAGAVAGDTTFEFPGRRLTPMGPPQGKNTEWRPQGVER